MKNARDKIALEIIQFLQGQLPGAAVSLRGSLADGKTDELSDIDIGVQDSQRTDTVVAELVIKCMGDSCDLVFHDWAKSLLPDECVITFFLSSLPLHWNIDVEITVPRSNRLLSPDDITYGQPDHYLKLWVILGKHLARNSNGHKEEIDGLCRKVLGKDRPAEGSIKQMRTILDALWLQADSAYPGFAAKCEEFMRRIEQGAAPYSRPGVAQG